MISIKKEMIPLERERGEGTPGEDHEREESRVRGEERNSKVVDKKGKGDKRGENSCPIAGVGGRVGGLKDHLSCIYSNVDTLLNKLTELLQVIAHDEPDVICLTEILPQNSRFPVELSEIQFEKYDCFSNIQDDHVHRGVVIYVKKVLGALPNQVNFSFLERESVWCEVLLKSGDRLLIGCIYRSPNCCHDNNDG